MFHLRSSKIILALCVLLFCSVSLQAQRARGNYNYLDFASKPYYFGITLGYNNANFKVFHSKFAILNDSIYNVESISGPGFNLGVITNLKVGQSFDLRLLPTLSFTERNLLYREKKGTIFGERKVESVLVELPFQVRYVSEPYHDMRMFILAGVKYSYDVASDSRARQAKNLVRISPTDFSVEYGAGVQIFFPYFIFSPEIKMSHGISNVMLYDGDLDEANILEKIMSRTFTISFNFEG